MRPAPIHLPVFQKFDCHSCGYCCRSLVVNVTDDERGKILDAGWAERIPGETLFIAYRFRGRKFQRLAHRPDGACVFLGRDGRCRLHAETGVHVKPLACRLYPFVPSPGAGTIRLDLRLDCPSAAANQGRPLAAHQREITGFVAETGARPMFAQPQWGSARALSDAEFEALVAAFTDVLAKSPLSPRDRLRAGCKLLDLVLAVRIGNIQDERFVELLHLLTQAVIEEIRSDERPAAPALPARPARLFRQWLFLHALTDDPADLAAGGIEKYRRSWARYLQSRRFAAGQGPAPRLRPDWPVTTFEAVAGVGPADDEALEPLIRSMRLKLDAHAFCGPAYFGYDVLRGLTALFLLPAVTGWFARLEAVRAGHEALTADDLLAGLRRAHHTFGVSPVFARISERLRLRALAQPEIPAALLARYGP